MSLSERNNIRKSNIILSFFLCLIFCLFPLIELMIQQLEGNPLGDEKKRKSRWNRTDKLDVIDKDERTQEKSQERKRKDEVKNPKASSTSFCATNELRRFDEEGPNERRRVSKRRSVTLEVNSRRKRKEIVRGLYWVFLPFFSFCFLSCRCLVSLAYTLSLMKNLKV